MGDKALLVVFFGTSVHEAQSALRRFSDAAKKSAGEGWKAAEACTSNIIRRKLKKEGLSIPTPLEALALLQDEGYKQVFVQPGHVIPGAEYDDLRSVVESLGAVRGKYGFKKLGLGRALLMNEKDCSDVAEIIGRVWEKRLAADEALILMGHGSSHLANALYSQVQTCLSRLSGRLFIGVVEGSPTLDDVLARLSEKGLKKAALVPFMVSAGDHARNDMAGPGAKSWKSVLQAQGIETRAFLEGFGDTEEFLNYFGGRVAQDIERF